MKVAFDARSLSQPVLRGWDRYTTGLVGELARLGIEVTLLYDTLQPLNKSHVAGLHCEIVGLPESNLLRWEQIALPRELRRGGYDLYHAPAEHGVPLRQPCPAVLTIHSVTGQSYADMIRRGELTGSVRDYLGTDIGRNSIASWYMWAQIRRARHIFTPSEFCRDEVIRLLQIAPERVTTTSLAVDEQFKRERSPEAERNASLERMGVKGKYLLFVGGYESHKNVGGLLDTFALVKQQVPDLSLVLVGSKTLPDAVRAKAIALGLRESSDVVFLVNLTHELTDLYDGAELFVTMSWRETFCLPALEAMTRGLAVVASSWGASREVIGDAGRLVDPRDPAAAARAVLETLAIAATGSPKEAARNQSSKFNWKRTAAQTLEAYRRVIDC